MWIFATMCVCILNGRSSNNWASLVFQSEAPESSQSMSTAVTPSTSGTASMPTSTVTLTIPETSPSKHSQGSPSPKRKASPASASESSPSKEKKKKESKEREEEAQSAAKNRREKQEEERQKMQCVPYLHKLTDELLLAGLEWHQLQYLACWNHNSALTFLEMRDNCCILLFTFYRYWLLGHKL